MPSIVQRHELSVALRTALGRSPAVALLGPRQVGKTTLARQLLNPGSPNYFDLERAADLKLDALFVLYPGVKRYLLADHVEVPPAASVAEFRG